jgi:hypothetical protein
MRNSVLWKIDKQLQKEKRAFLKITTHVFYSQRTSLVDTACPIADINVPY